MSAMSLEEWESHSCTFYLQALAENQSVTQLPQCPKLGSPILPLWQLADIRILVNYIIETFPVI